MEVEKGQAKIMRQSPAAQVPLSAQPQFSFHFLPQVKLKRLYKENIYEYPTNSILSILHLPVSQ
jgi:hypothetical protein